MAGYCKVPEQKANADCFSAVWRQITSTIGRENDTEKFSGRAEMCVSEREVKKKVFDCVYL